MKKIIPIVACMLLSASVNAVTVASVKAAPAQGVTLSVDDVLARCRVKAGDEYDPALCARDVRQLRDSGEYDEVHVTAEYGEGGVEVVYVVKPKLRFLGPLNVKGNDFWNAGKIAGFAELKDGYAYGESDYAAAAGRVRREYQKRFFSDVKVTPVTEPVAGSADMVSVTFEIEEGERRKINEYAFSGNDSIEASELRETFGCYPWWNPIGWFTDEPATDQDFAEARDKVAELYRNRGFLDVEVSLPQAVEVEDGKLNRVFTVKEGPCYHVGKMSVKGVTQYSAEEALAAVNRVATGDIAGATVMRDAAHQIEVFCGSGKKPLSETHVDVRYLPGTGTNGVLDVVFDVHEGVPVKINRIVIRGNDYTKDKVIRREIGLSPGDRMLDDRAELSKHRLENLRYFERVRYYLERLNVDDTEKHQPGEPELRDLVYEVAEKNTGNFMVGVGASSVDSVYGTIELSESNFDLFNPWRFRGAGQKGRILLQAGPRVQTYEASVTEPHLFDRLLELTVEGYRRQRWFDEYDIIRNGAAVTLSYPVKFWPSLPTFGRLGFRLSAEFIEFDDVENSKWYNPKTGRSDWKAFKEEEEEYGDSWEIPFRVFWADDTRDNFLVPTRGHRVNIYGDVVTGDNEYWRAGFSASQYLTTWKRFGHVLSMRLRGETVDTFSGDLPIYDRLFLGGPRSIRGVDYREIAPRVYKRKGHKGKYEPWGGQTSWCGTFEYTVPVVKYVRLAAFTDFGSVGEDEFDFDADWFCWTVGLGVRIDIESFPIRLDFATPVCDPDEDVDEEVFSFTIGYDF